MTPSIEPSSCEIARLFLFLFDWQKRRNLSEKIDDFKTKIITTT